MMRASEAQLALTRRALAASALMLAVAASTAALKPAARPAPSPPDLESLIPDQFGEWTRAEIAGAVLPDEMELKRGEAVAYRAYRNRDGRIVTLVVAYGPPLGDSVRLHRPESCYVAQGYEIRSRTVEPTTLAGADAAIVKLSTLGPSRPESVTYWLRSGAEFVTAPSGSPFSALNPETWTPRDGALVRASSPGDTPLLFDAQRDFLEALAASLTVEGRAVLLGIGPERPS